jgi:HEPN domain-containing protein
MPGADPARQAREARRWVARADVDATAAERLLTGTPPLPSVAAFHCQQAAEKLLKAALVRAGVRPRKTHDLTSLADEAVRLLPTLATLADPLRPRTLWSFAFRYPLDEGVDEPEPTVAEIRTVLDQLVELRAAVLRVIEEDRGGTSEERSA